MDSPIEGAGELQRLATQLERAQTLEAEFRAFADSARDYAFITLSLDQTVVGSGVKGQNFCSVTRKMRFLANPGRRFWGTGVLTLLRDALGQMRGSAKVMRDQTERRTFQEALAASDHGGVICSQIMSSSSFRGGPG